MSGAGGGPSGRDALRLALLAKRARADGVASLPEPVAIVGMACRFPGGAGSPEAFWRFIEGGGDAVHDVPPDRWSIEEWFDPDPSTPGRTSVKAGGFLDDVTGFDHDFFGIPLREAERMDPHQRLALEVAWEALEDAGARADAVWEKRVGVFAASYNNDYVLHQYLRPEAINERTITGTVHSIVANRLSHFLGLVGPSITLDTACSSSLVTVHLACRSLRDGSSDTALAGGVSLMLRPEPFVALSKAGFMSPDGRCKTFDAGADGFGRGEGCGFVVLKRLADALADGDRIHAVIRGSAVNQDGHSTILAAPNGRSQVEVVRAALEDGRVDPAAVSFIEAHGTGTRLGDPIEVESLAEALGAPVSGDRWITSVKANIGHLEAAAGIAGIIKATLCLRHRRIPPQALFREENPLLGLAGHGFRVPREGVAWTAEGPLTVGVSSFGVGGTNAHVVLEEAPTAGRSGAEAGSPGAVLALSARNGPALDDMALRYAERLEGAAGPPVAAVAAVCAGAAAGRSRFEHRLAVAAADAGELATRLRSAAEGISAPGVSRGRVTASDPGRVVWVFTGQGSQWPGLGLALAGESDVFREALEEVDRTLAPLAGWSVLDALRGEAGGYDLDDTLCAQVAIFAVQVGLARLLRDWGFEPDGVVGHSVGEVAAAHVAGLLTLDAAVQVVFHRGRVMQEAEPGGGMLAARLSPEDAAPALEGRSGVELAVRNGPASVVLSGDADAIDDVEARLRGDGVKVKRLAVEYGFHSRRMAPFESRLREDLPDFEAGRSSATFYSTVTGAALPAGAFDEAYVARNVVSPVRFYEAVAAAVGEGAAVFVELGPRPTLVSDIVESAAAAGVDVTAAATLDPGSPGLAGPKGAVGALFCAGVEGDWDRIHGTRTPDRDLPTYPWQRVRCWLDAPERGGGGERGTGLLGRRLDSPAIDGVLYERGVKDSDREVSDHVIGGSVLVPAAMMLEMARRAAGPGLPEGPVVAGASFLAPLALSEDERRIHASVRGGSDAESFAIHVRGPSGGWRRVFAADRIAGPAAEAELPNVEEIEGRCSAALDHGDFYALAGRRRCAFGPRYRRLESVSVGTGEALGRLDAGGYDPTVGPEPALLDAALQPVLALLGDGHGTLVPASVARYEWRPAVRPRWSWVRERGDGPDGTRVFDVRVLGEDGEPAGVVAGLAMKELPAGFAHVLDPARDLYTTRWVPVEDPGDVVEADPVRRWVVYGFGGIAGSLGERLEAAGADVAVVSTVAELTAGREDGPWGVVLLLEPSGPAGLDRVQEIAEPLLEGVARSAAPPERLVAVARESGGEEVREAPWSAALEGLVRTLKRELPSISATALTAASPESVDLDLVARLCAGRVSEPVLRIRSGRLVRPRLERLDRSTAAGGGAAQVLVLETPGDLDSIDVRTVARRAPGPREVEVAVRVATLNFRDVLAAVGLVEARTEEALGHEGAGRVTRVGAEVTDLAPGDDVLVLAEGAFGTHVTCGAHRVFAGPGALDRAAGATLPIPYLTAFHALVVAGDVRKGQRILVHSGAGGVGQAVIRLGRALGAEVFATAGSPERRALVRELGATDAFDSRSLDFRDDLLEATGGEGVDIVVNARAGDAVEAGLDLLPRGGVFVELGKRDLRDPAEVAEAHPGLEYHAFDLFDEIDADPERYREAWARILGLLGDGSLAPLPYRTYPFERAADALRLMRRAGHVGRVLLRLPGRNGAGVEADGVHLVTGATGAVGLASVEWLADRGARHLVVVSRTRPEGEAGELFDGLRQRGVAVAWIGADLTTPAGVAAVIEKIGEAGRPLRGVIHSAGALHDALLRDVGPDALATAFGAKVLGARGLLEHVAPEELDFVLLYSAAGSSLDPAGQGTYAAANAVIDRLGEQLRERGWPATSVQWGLWEGGMAGRLAGALRDRWQNRGLRPIGREEAGPLLDHVLRADVATVAPLPVDWAAYAAAVGDPDPLFSGVTSEEGRASGGGADLRGTLSGLPPRRRREALRTHLRDRLLRVLGRAADADVDDTVPFHDLDMDSLMAVEYRNVLTRDFGVTLSATITFDHPHLEALVGHLEDVLFGSREAAEAAPAPPVSPEVPAPASTGEVDVASLSEEEAERLLLAELEAVTGEDG